MAQFAEHVVTDQAEIDRLKAMILVLDEEARVEVELDDGRVLAGAVAIKPTLQVFHDPQGNEGTNGVLRLDDALEPEKPHFIPLASILRVRRLEPDQQTILRRED